MESAASITLITDCWTGLYSNIEFLGLAAQISDHFFDKELIILGMIELIGGHSAENIQSAIETIVKSYNFDKKKIKGKLSLFQIYFSNKIIALFLSPGL